MPFRITLMFAAGLGLLAVVSMVRADWMTDLGLDWWRVSEYQQQLRNCAQRYATLEAEDRLILDRIAVKDELMADLLSKRLTLLETAAWFRHVDHANPGPVWGPFGFPGSSEDERYCRQVMYWARIHSHEWAAGQRDMLQCRLEAELEEHLASHDGRVELPDLDGREVKASASSE
jgi:hypothetical protein